MDVTDPKNSGSTRPNHILSYRFLKSKLSILPKPPLDLTSKSIQNA